MGLLKCRLSCGKWRSFLIGIYQWCPKAYGASEAAISETCRLLKLCLLAYDVLELTEHFTELRARREAELATLPANVRGADFLPKLG